MARSTFHVVAWRHLSELPVSVECGPKKGQEVEIPFFAEFLCMKDNIAYA